MRVHVKLSEPLEAGGKPHSKIYLRSPNAGELRGILLPKILQMDVVEIAKLTTRISDPALTLPQIEALSAADYMALAGRVVGFFISPAEMEKLQNQPTSIDAFPSA